MRWVQLPRSECSKAGGLYELVPHEMNANSRGDGGGGGIPMSLLNQQAGACLMLFHSCGRSYV